MYTRPYVNLSLSDQSQLVCGQLTCKLSVLLAGFLLFLHCSEVWVTRTHVSKVENCV